MVAFDMIPLFAPEKSDKPGWAKTWIWRDPDTPRRCLFDRALPWAPGPWDDEPDVVSWRGSDLREHGWQGPQGMLGSPRLMLRNFSGAWCGYVGVGPDHPLYGAALGDERLEVLGGHAGITYSGRSDDKDAVRCAMREGEPPVWWLGFDCNHGFDATPGYERLLPSNGRHYRRLELVVAQCELLAYTLGLAANGVVHHGNVSENPPELGAYDEDDDSTAPLLEEGPGR